MLSTISCLTVWLKIAIPYEAPLQGAVANLPDVVGSLTRHELVSIQLYQPRLRACRVCIACILARRCLPGYARLKRPVQMQQSHHSAMLRLLE